MAFTVKCFVRKIDNKLINRLEKLGYKDGYSLGIHPAVVETHTATIPKTGEWTLAAFCDSWKDYIDCGENVELFMALAALRDDSDIFQLFSDGYGNYVKPHNEDAIIELKLGGWKKLTVNDIITYYGKS